MRLLIQPGDGISALVEGIDKAKKLVEIAIFRFDRTEIERALQKAVHRGVSVRALIAYTNRGGEPSLRKLEMRLLEAGVAVTRTARDLVRYHGKYMIIDRRDLYLLAFNFTYQDIERSRSFGVIIRDRRLVEEAAKLFDADTRRVPYGAGLASFVVSPANARKQLAAFVRGARKQLLIYDPKVTDAALIRLLQDRAQAGVEIKLIGKLNRKRVKLEARRPARLRLHTRTMVRDSKRVFIGSQSLREMELDSRREVGVIFRDSRIANRLVETFQEDWALMEKTAPNAAREAAPANKAAKVVAKAITKELPPVAPVLKEAVKEVVGEGVRIDEKEIEETVKDALKDTVTEVVQEVLEDAVEQKEKAG
ncbi:MAG TPA: phospholipase D-like domain-containing protein [Terriglobia bacterium]|nr:phospholipase D-like domain-containing protein [Terriglobia bacterium]